MTWTLHGASPVVSPKVESFKISTASRPRLCKNVANISFSTEPLRKRCLRHPWWLVIISLFDQRWCPLISHEMLKTMKTQFYASCLFHEPHKHCLRNWNSYQLPTTISHLLVSNKNTKNSPTMKSTFVSTKKCFPWEKNRTCDSWGWCARWTLPPMGSTVMGTKIIKIVGKRLVNGSSFELAIYHGFLLISWSPCPKCVTGENLIAATPEICVFSYCDEFLLPSPPSDVLMIDAQLFSS